RDLGPEPVPGRRRHHAARAADRKRLRRSRQFRHRRHQFLDLQPGHHRRRRGAAGADLRAVALYPLRPDRARHHAESGDGRRARHRHQADLHADLRLRLGADRAGRGDPGADQRRLADHGRVLRRQGLHHRHRRRPAAADRHPERERPVRRDRRRRVLSVELGGRRDGGAVRRHCSAPPAAARHHRPAAPGDMMAVRGIGMGDAAKRPGWAWWLFVVVAAVLLVLLPEYIDISVQLDLSIIFVLALLALSMSFLWGYVGMLSFGQTVFFGLGGYSYAVLGLNIGSTSLPFLVAILLPMLFAAILGYFMIYGRISDIYLSVITLVVTLIFEKGIRATSGDRFVIGSVRLNGQNGIPTVPSLQVPWSGQELGTDG